MNKKSVFVAIALIILPLTFFLVYIISQRGPQSYEVIFYDNQKAYTSIAELVYDDYCQSDKDSIFIYDIDLAKKELVCYSIDKKIPLSDEQLINAEIVKTTYRLDKQSLYAICVFDRYVSFGNINGRAAFIYSADDTKPKYVNSPNDYYKKIYSRKLTDNWYFASGR